MSDRITLVDVKTWCEEARFGTCSICGYDGVATYQDLVFKDSNGKTFTIQLYEWDYGDFYSSTYLEPCEVCEFAEFIYNKKIKERKELKDNIEKIIDEFYIGE